MPVLAHSCRCLTTLDRRDGHRCEHDSWGTRRPSSDQHWASPHRDIPLPLVWLISVAVGVLLAGLLLVGQTVMCNVHDDSLSYCPGYQPAQEVPQ